MKLDQVIMSQNAESHAGRFDETRKVQFDGLKSLIQYPQSHEDAREQKAKETAPQMNPLVVKGMPAYEPLGLWGHACQFCSNVYGSSLELKRHVRSAHAKGDETWKFVDFTKYYIQKRPETEGYICGGRLKCDSDPRWGCHRYFETATALYEHLRSGDGKDCLEFPQSLWELQDNELHENRSGDHSSSALESGAESYRTQNMSREILPAVLLKTYPELKRCIRNTGGNDGLPMITTNWDHGNHCLPPGSDLTAAQEQSLDNRDPFQQNDLISLYRALHDSPDTTDTVGKYSPQLAQNVLPMSIDSRRDHLVANLKQKQRLEPFNPRLNNSRCLSCKRRRVKCEGGDATCENCRRLDLKCEWETQIKWVYVVPHTPRRIAPPFVNYEIPHQNDSGYDTAGPQGSSETIQHVKIHKPKEEESVTNDDGSAEADTPTSTSIASSLSRPCSNSDGENSFVGVSTYTNRDIYTISEFKTDTWNFIYELAENIVTRSLIPRGSHSIKTCPQSQNNTSSSSLTTFNVKTAKSSGAKSMKRPRQISRCSIDHEGDDDDDDDDEAPHGLKRPKSGDVNLVRLLACPFAKFDPERYSEMNQIEKHYRKCASKYLVNITRVKQHLYRTHMRPAWYCGNCYETFKTRDELNAHNRQRPPCDEQPAKYDETMTDDQYQEVKRRSQGGSDRESWYKIFDALFPDVQRPLSPYVANCNSAAVQHFVSLFRWFGPEEFHSLLRARRDRGDVISEIDASTQAVVDEAFEIALPFYLDQSDTRQELHNQTANTSEPTTIETQADSSFSPTAPSQSHDRWPRINQSPRDSRIGGSQNDPNIRHLGDQQQPFGSTTFTDEPHGFSGVTQQYPQGVLDESDFNTIEINRAFDAYVAEEYVDLLVQSWDNSNKDDIFTHI